MFDKLLPEDFRDYLEKVMYMNYQFGKDDLVWEGLKMREQDVIQANIVMLSMLSSDFVLSKY